MVQNEKFSKKKAKKAAASARHSSERDERQDAASMAGIPAAERHGEEFEVRKPVKPPGFSPIIDDISLPEELTPTPEDVASDISPIADDLPAFSAEDGPSVGAKRSQFFSGATHTPSPPQTPDLAEMNTVYHPPNANKHVETTGEPEGARIKRRRGADGAAVDGESGDVGLFN